VLYISVMSATMPCGRKKMMCQASWTPNITIGGMVSYSALKIERNRNWCLKWLLYRDTEIVSKHHYYSLQEHFNTEINPWGLPFDVQCIMQK